MYSVFPQNFFFLTSRSYSLLFLPSFLSSTTKYTIARCFCSFMLGKRKNKKTDFVPIRKIQKIDPMEFKDKLLFSTTSAANPIGVDSGVGSSLEDEEKRIRGRETQIEKMQGDIEKTKKKCEKVKSDIAEVKSEIEEGDASVAVLEAKKKASTLTKDENCELVQLEKKLDLQNERLGTLEKLLLAYFNQLPFLRSQLLKEEDALRLLQSSSGVSEITKVVQSGFETQIQAVVPNELETASLYTAEELAANDLAKALSYGLIDASHPLLKTREGCKAYVKFKESLASSKEQCLSFCYNLVSCSAMYFQII